MPAIRALCCLAALLLLASSCSAGTSETQRLDSAQFAAGLQDHEAAAAEPWQTVPLPHDWREGGVPRPGEGRYRLNLDVPAHEAGRHWAVWSARFPLYHRVRLDGHLIADSWDVRNVVSPRTAPLLLHMPPALLRAGSHELEIDERGGQRAGLGTLVVGPEAWVQQQAAAWRRLHIELPRLLNGAAAGTALFAMLLWLLRRQEKLTGLFGLVSLLLALRNFVFLEPALASNNTLGSVGMFAAACTVVLLYAHFCLVVAGRASRASGAVFLGIGAVCAVLCFWALGSPDETHRIRVLAYPLLMLPGAVGTMALFQHASRQPLRQLWLLAGTGLVLFGSGVHDYLLQTGRMPHTHDYAFVWTAPLLSLAYGLLLGRRVVGALREAETGRQVLERRVAERTASLAEANAAKSRFLASASHDLRQPLVSIGLLVGLLRQQITAPAQQRLVARVDDGLDAMESLLRGLLDLSRLEAAHTPVRPHSVALRPLLAALLAQEHAAADRKGLRLRLHAPANPVAWVDRVLLEQIVRNLLGNALRYTAAGGVLLTVRRRGDHWRLQVWDTGTGIALERQAQVFEEFVQGDNAHRDRHGGLGLGLAIVRRAAGLLGSSVLLRSVPGRGSCFGIDLPLATDKACAPADDLQLASRASAGGGVTAHRSAQQLQGQWIWLVEDDDAVRDALADSLSTWGAAVTTMRSAAELAAVIAQARQSGRRPALLLTDMRLPGGKDGLAVARQVLDALGPLPILVITGNSAPEDMAALATSGLPVLHKPFRAEALRRALLALLN